MLHTIDTTYGPILFHFNLSFALLKLPFGSNKWTYEKYLYKFIFQSAISFHQIIRREDEAKAQRWLSKHAIKKKWLQLHCTSLKAYCAPIQTVSVDPVPVHRMTSVIPFQIKLIDIRARTKSKRIGGSLGWKQQGWRFSLNVFKSPGSDMEKYKCGELHWCIRMRSAFY